MQSGEEYDGKKDYCKNNKNISKYLYVGRSKTLRSRINQHIGGKHEGIFAMHLQRWATQLNCQVEISYYKFSDKPNLIIQSIEDGIWQSVKPMLGRKEKQ